MLPLVYSVMRPSVLPNLACGDTGCRVTGVDDGVEDVGTILGVWEVSEFVDDQDLRGNQWLGPDLEADDRLGADRWRTNRRNMTKEEYAKNLREPFLPDRLLTLACQHRHLKPCEVRLVRWAA
jgi:hypothetical protein